MDHPSDAEVIKETVDIVENGRPWMELAACADFPEPEVFFPDRGTSLIGKLICSTCVVVDNCLDYALTHHVKGIWGRTTESERKAIRREHNLPEPERESYTRGQKVDPGLGEVSGWYSREWQG